MRLAVILMGVWVAVEILTVWAAGFSGGPFVPLVANDNGVADAHTRRFAAFLTALMGLNIYAIFTSRFGHETKGNKLETIRRKTVVHTVLVANVIAMVLALIVECIHGDGLAVGWHIALLWFSGYILLPQHWTGI